MVKRLDNEIAAYSEIMRFLLLCQRQRKKKYIYVSPATMSREKKKDFNLYVRHLFPPQIKCILYSLGVHNRVLNFSEELLKHQIKH